MAGVDVSAETSKDLRGRLKEGCDTEQLPPALPQNDRERGLRGRVRAACRRMATKEA
jgi:hypothetical protein